MRKLMFAVTLALVGLLTPLAGQAAESRRGALIVIALEGFRADYLALGLTPTLTRIGAEGVHAERLIPVFPTNSYPNFYTLMTGLPPDGHGVIDTLMRDPALPAKHFGRPFPDDSRNPFWWEGAKPLWISAEEQGLRTAASYWPATELPLWGRTASYVQTGSPRPTPQAQIDGVLSWMDLPVDQRPRLVLLGLDRVDNAGHVFGPGSPQVARALTETDRAMARLLAGLASRGLERETSVVIVSDVGMASISRERMIYADDLFDLAHAQITTFGANLGVNPRPGYESELAQALVRRHPHLTCRRGNRLPARLNWGHHRRTPRWFCLADLGWTVGVRATLDATPPILGNHGYDNAFPSMHGVFLARGPDLRRRRLASIQSAEVYPLLARLLDVRPEPGRSRGSAVLSALHGRRSPPARRADTDGAMLTASPPIRLPVQSTRDGPGDSAQGVDRRPLQLHR